MPVTPTIQNVQPTVGGSADTWGGILNDRLEEAYDDINALATQSNSNETLANGALQRAGGTMTGPIALGNPTPNTAGASDAGFRGLPVISIDADRTFGVTDSGKCIRLTGTTSRTWTIPPATLPVGTVIVVRVYGTQPLTIARGSGVSLRLPGSATDANRTVSTQGFASLWQEDTNVWVISGVGAA